MKMMCFVGETHRARMSDYIAVDAVRDELAVPNPFAQAILFFCGGGSRQEANNPEARSGSPAGGSRHA